MDKNICILCKPYETQRSVRNWKPVVRNHTKINAAYGIQNGDAPSISAERFAHEENQTHSEGQHDACVYLPEIARELQLSPQITTFLPFRGASTASSCVTTVPSGNVKALPGGRFFMTAIAFMGIEKPCFFSASRLRSTIGLTYSCRSLPGWVRSSTTYPTHGIPCDIGAA